MRQARVQKRAILMTGFISLVIIAGCFGPYVISLLLAGLSLACVVALA